MEFSLKSSTDESFWPSYSVISTGSSSFGFSMSLPTQAIKTIVLIEITMKQAEMVPLSGSAEFGVALLRQEQDIKAQLDKIEPKLLAECLSEYGSWDEKDLQDHNKNIDRLLWIAACDIQEEG